jgi:hypothetical protein
MQEEALKELLRLNLSAAHRLMLLALPDEAAIDSFIAEPFHWDDPSMAPDKKFDRAVDQAHYRFLRQWRYRRGGSDTEVLLERVTTFDCLKHALRQTAPAGRAGFAAVVSEFNRLEPAFGGQLDDPANAAAVTDSAAMMANLRGEITSHRARPFVAPASSIHAPGSCCWIAQPAHVAALAQDYRDRLGLWHYPRGASIGDQLVVMQFAATLSPGPCPVAFSPDFADATPNGCWLVRPTVMNWPNVRFVQAHAGDRKGVPADHGMTIDIATSAYPEGEHELILLAGRDVLLGWHDVDLLTGGLPIRSPHDADHVDFSRQMRARIAGFF